MSASHDSSFKLISRDDKINIYDPYADKYYVVEDDEELNKILDDNGKLIPDEQIRQYFNSKESKSRKIQRGFVTKKANLKKEYASVEKQVFNDLIKYKLYNKYGDVLSNDDISAFNKNPSINTIKNFKSIRPEIKTDMQSLFKSNESQFSQDFEDKNNLASILNELRNMNQSAYDNVFNQRKFSYMVLANDIEDAIKAMNTNNKLGINAALNKARNNYAQMLDNNREIQTVLSKTNPSKEELEKIHKTIKNEERKNEIQSEHYNNTKWIVKDDYIDIPNDVRLKNAKDQLANAKTIYGYNMVPIQSLYKNLAYLNSDPDNYETLDKISFADNGKTYDIEIDFGDKAEYQFKYTIAKDSPYANEMIPYIDNMSKATDYNAFKNLYQQMSDNVIQKYDATKSVIKSDKDIDNEVNFENRLKKDNVDDYEAYMKENPKKIKIVDQIKNEKISFNDFDTFNKAITTAKWYDEETFEPEIEFNQEREAHANNQWYKTPSSKNLVHPIQHPLQHALATSEKDPDRHYYKNNMSKLINEQADVIVDKIIEANKEAQNMDKDTLKQLIIGNAYQNVRNYETETATKIQIPFVVPVHTDKTIPKKPGFTYKLDYDYDSAPDQNLVFEAISKTLYDIPKTHKKENTTVKKRTEETINAIDKIPKLKTAMLDGINELQNDINDNLSKAHYWYWTDKYVDYDNRFEVYDPSNKPSRIRPMQRKDIQTGIHKQKENYDEYARQAYAPVNVISPNLNRAYKMRNVDPNVFYKGFGGKNQIIRDILATKLNNRIRSKIFK